MSRTSAFRPAERGGRSRATPDAAAPREAGCELCDSGFSVSNYDEAISRLEQAGAGFGQVPGRTFHCAMESDGQVRVFDVWDSMEQFEKFGETLVPIMRELGSDPGEPMVMTVHNLQSG